MGTKAEPGQFDCYLKAEDDEPLFTLRAKDPIAPFLVQVWRCLRGGNTEAAILNVRDAARAWEREVEIGRRTFLTTDSEKSKEARKCATDMEKWRARYESRRFNN